MKNKLNQLLLAFLCLTSVTQLVAQTTGTAYPDARETLEEGIALFDRGKYKEAIKQFHLIHENDSFYHNALYELSISYEADKQYEKARDYALKGLKMNTPLEREFIVAYANALEELNQVDSALKVYDYGLALYPFHYRFEFEKGVTYAKRKDWKKALEHYTAALKINPFHSASHLRIGFMAADANKPSFALMALNTFCMISTSPERILQCIQIMEKIANNGYEPEFKVDENVFDFAKDLEEIDLIIHSKAALSDKYKAQVKLPYHILKQMQVLCEKLPAESPSDDWIFKLYYDLYKSIWNNKMYVGAALHTFRTIESKEVQSQLKSKEKEISAFQAFGTNYLAKFRDEKTIIKNGKEERVRLWFVDGILRAIGERNTNGKNIGRWVYYGEEGHISAEGEFENGQKIGFWKYYYPGGQLKSEEYYKGGLNHGSYKKYYTNGAIEEISEYENDIIANQATLYNPNNTLRARIPLTNGKVNGVRYNYNDLGQLDNAGELKDGNYEGWYKTYHTNGQLNLDGKTTKGNLNGSAIYYHKDGSKKLTGSFANGERNGQWTWYYSDGKIETTGAYNNGKETGIWKYYYENGNLEKEELYENGAKKGSYKLYDQNGLIYAELFVKNGRMDAYKYFDVNGKIITEGKTSSGKLNFVRYSEYRHKIIEGTYINGLEDGIWKYYYENGALEYELPYSKGSREGLMKYYSKNGNLQYELYYENDQREGFYRSYFANGNKNVEGYYKQGQRYGTWDYYYANGKFDTREFYMNEEIVGKDYEFMPDGNPDGYSSYELGFFKGYTQTDSNGVVFHETTLKHGNGYYTLYSPKKTPIVHAKYVGGVKDSIYTSYYGKGKIMSLETYVMGKRHGIYKRFFENGKIQQIGYYKDGEQDSTWNYYNEDGTLWRISNFKNGDYHGAYKTFYSNGKTDIECTYYKDLKHGKYKEYSYEGILVLDADFNGGVLESYSYLGKDGNLLPRIAVTQETADIKTYFPNGTLAISYKIVNGLMQGEYVFNYQNGTPFIRSTYKDGKNEGQYRSFYANGNPKKTENYFYDDKNGLCVYYHENGKISKEINYLLDYKHGDAKYYDATGKLISKINYRYNRIDE